MSAPASIALRSADASERQCAGAASRAASRTLGFATSSRGMCDHFLILLWGRDLRLIAPEGRNHRE